MRSNDGSTSGDEFGLRPSKGLWSGVRKSLGNLVHRSSQPVAAAKVESGAGLSAHTLDLLTKKKIFEKLDERLCPANSAHARAWCQGGFELTVRLLSEAGIESEQVEPMLEELAASGSSCDCGVLFNSAKESRLKTEYWLARALNGESFDPHAQLKQNGPPNHPQA
jgi:hypothetical protein